MAQNSKIREKVKSSRYVLYSECIFTLPQIIAQYVYAYSAYHMWLAIYLQYEVKLSIDNSFITFCRLLLCNCQYELVKVILI